MSTLRGFAAFRAWSRSVPGAELDTLCHDFYASNPACRDPCGLGSSYGGATLSWSSKSVDFITLFTEDLERSKGFYQDVFGLRPIFEDDNSAVFRFANTGINVLRAGLVSPAAVADRNAGTRLVFTIGVDDVDAVCAELAARGVELLNGPLNRPWGVRTASFTDPGGHVWEVAQELPRADGS
jgi:catechol 2,3-dioxygenase-like lactoylglutathione lyase family enzyme